MIDRALSETKTALTALPADIIQFFELCDLYVTVQEHTMCKEPSHEKSFEELMLRF